MPSTMESVSIITQAVRTLLAVVVVGGLGVAGWFGYEQLHSTDLKIKRAEAALADAQQQLAQKDKQIVSLEGVVDEQAEEIDRLDTAMRLLKVDHRVARLTVVAQKKEPESDTLVSVVQFQEIDAEGKPTTDPNDFRPAGRGCP